MKGPLDSGEAPKTDGYNPVDTHDQEMKAGREAGDSNANGRETEQSKNTKPALPLSSTQLILRRGTTLLISVLILIVGVVFFIVFPVPDRSAQSMANFTLNGSNHSTPTPMTLLNLTLDF